MCMKVAFAYMTNLQTLTVLNDAPLLPKKPWFYYECYGFTYLNVEFEALFIKIILLISSYCCLKVILITDEYGCSKGSFY